ncbi:Peptidoglycan/xylan/chitin deacetylase, PgdA/CDA1 family [Arenibacter palladensis]|uniref:Peptidoglycan/xylan/chitin deacetylase, PgdA/CDA1 family n=1 Tax=Arenibacter palladensis TaxID=237373 RepID=A0A1M5A4W2_9FLAO|nr:polysaccharide deacetylase family protein [Arenibacter palladensis]SHF25301.1 Peptidoglycan/xylan/chitin deacetylase, PgdA/CDA1 family [Arenibacter palladensis]
MKKCIPFVFILFIVTIGYSQILKKEIPDKLVVLTFDDAPASQYSVVAPLLKDFGFGATFFVCEFPPNHKDSTLYMNWRQIKALDKMGFEVANHTHTHANVSKLTQSEFNAELEYIENKCDSLGIQKPQNFAYPGYGLNANALEYLQKKEYAFARAGGNRAYDPLTDHPFLIPSWATNADNKNEIISALEEAKNGKIVVITLHGVPDVEHPWVNTPPKLFREYLQYLSDQNFKVVSLRDLQAYIDVDIAKGSIVPDLDSPLKN